MQNGRKVEQTDDYVQEGLPFDIEGDILDYDSRGDNLILISLDWSGGRIDLRCWRGTSGGRKVGVIVRRERPVVGGRDGTFHPLLRCSVSLWFGNDKSVKKTHRRQPTPQCLVLERRLAEGERVVLRLGGDWRRGGIVVLGSCTTIAIIAFVIVRIVNALLGWL